MYFGRNLSARELQEHCGSPNQLGRITPCELSDGKEKGVRCLNFHTGGGLSFSVLPDRAMDIGFAEYKGRSLAWMSPTSIVAPTYYEPEEWNWIRGFYGGLLTTCGLLNVGKPDSYKDEPVGAHGRISYTPASNVSHDTMWVGDDLYLLAKGEMRESRLGQYNYRMQRSIQCLAGDKSIRIHDRVTNEGYEKVPLQILYHINIGFPVLNRTSYLLAPSKGVTPRDEAANDDKEHYSSCIDPTRDFKEKVYYHDLVPCTDGRAWAALVNPDLDGGMGVYVKYDPKTLPLLVEWKMMGQGTYVMGLEPSNTYGIGMSRANSLGMLKAIEPGETIDYRVEIGVLDGADEIHAFEREVSVVSPQAPVFGSILI